MAAFLRNLFGGAYSYAALRQENDTYFTNPQFPDGIPKAMSLFDGKTRTFLKYIQDHYDNFLKQIAAKPTRLEQRTELLTLCLQEISWRALYRAAKDAKHVASWDHFAKDSEWFSPFPKDQWRKLLMGRYLAAMAIYPWLITTGSRLYNVEPYIEAALDLSVDYDAEIKQVDVNFAEVMLDKLSAHEDGLGFRIAKLKDEVVTPVINEQYHILERLNSDIKTGTLDVPYYRQEFARIDKLKQHVGRAITALL